MSAAVHTDRPAAEGDRALIEDVAWASRILAMAGYEDLTLGHVSVRGSDGHTIYIKRKGVALSEVTPSDVLAVDMRTGLNGGPPGMHLETVLHTEVYKRRPDVGSVVHGHPPCATAFGATDAEFAYLTHDSVLFVGGISRYDGIPELIVDEQQGADVADALGDRRAVLLRNHGVLLAERDVRWAVLASVLLERACHMQVLAGALGPLPSDSGADAGPDPRREVPGRLRKGVLGCLGPRASTQRRRFRYAGNRVMDISLTVNGREVDASVEPQELLLDFLREHLGLTGAKRSCDMQVCGACTVLVDGGPVSGCTFLAVEADGREVLTVEGFAELPEFEIFEQAFVRHAAVQCGYCTSGMLLTLKSLRDAGELRTEEDIRHGLEGNICRCTGYSSIIAAAMELIDMTVIERRELKEVGVSRPRKDAREKLSGKAQYVGDMEMAGMLHGKVLRSPYAHAEIVGIDVSRALELEGVAAVLTGADLDDIEPYYGHAIKDRPIIALDRVRFAGEPVVAVAAVDEATGEAALRLIDVEYEPLPVVDTLEKALADGAPPLHSAGRRSASSTASASSASSRATSAISTGSGPATSNRCGQMRRSSSRANTSSRRSISTRWRRTRRSPTTTETA